MVPFVGPSQSNLAHRCRSGAIHPIKPGHGAKRRTSITRLALILGAMTLASPAFAAGIDSRAYTCADLQRMITIQGFVFINNPNFKDFVVANSSYCSGGGGGVVPLRRRSVP